MLFKLFLKLFGLWWKPKRVFWPVEHYGSWVAIQPLSGIHGFYSDDRNVVQRICDNLNHNH